MSTAAGYFPPAADVPMYVSSSATSSERRITPSWTIGDFKSRMELVTGIPAGCQSLMLRSRRTGIEATKPSEDGTPIAADDEEKVTMGEFGLFKYGEIYITDTRPPSEQTRLPTVPNSDDLSAHPQLAMTESHYDALPNTVRAWKREHQVGRFDPAAPAKLEAVRQAQDRAIAERGIEVGKRCRVGGDDTKRGVVMYVGDVDGLPGPGGAKWVGVKLDEPSGKNDGSVMVEEDDDDDEDGEDGQQRNRDGSGDGAETVLKPTAPGLELVKKKKVVPKRYFSCPPKYGVFVRPDRVEVGEFPEMDDLDGLLDTDDELAEI